MREIRGVIPPVITPVTESGEVDYPALVSNLARWNRTALAGYLILGSNSEFVYLSEEEKVRILEITREHIPRDMVLIAGTGCEATQATITLTRREGVIREEEKVRILEIPRKQFVAAPRPKATRPTRLARGNPQSPSAAKDIGADAV